MPIYRTTAVITHPSLGGNGTNTWHARTSGTIGDQEGDLEDLQDAIELFYNACNDVLAGGTNVSGDGVWTPVDDPEGTVLGVPTWSSTSGTSIAPLPPSQCLVVGWGTAGFGKSARGRTFVGPIGVNALQDNGTPTEVGRTAVVNGANALIASFAGTLDGALGVWSTSQSIFRDFTRAAVANRFSVLRSRRD